MKKILLSATLILLTCFLIAQDTLKQKRFYVGAFASPDYSYRILPNNTGFNKTIADLRNSYEIPKFAYTVGIEASYKINKWFNFSLGVQYSIKGEQTKNQDLTYSSSQPRRGFVYNNYPGISKMSIKYNDAYLDIPLRLDIYFTRKKIAPFITTGISTNIFLYERNIAHETFSDGHQITNSSINSNSGYNRVNLQGQFGAGIDIAFKKSNFRIFPIYRMSVLRVNSGSVNGYFYSLGLGLNYFFRV